MARTLKNPTKRQSTRPTRTSAPVSFKNDDEFDAIEKDDTENDDLDMDGGDDSADMLNQILAEYKKRESKKVSARSAAFQTQKKALYAAARKAAKDLARDGTACLEEGKAKLTELKREEVSADKYSKDVVPLWHSLEVAHFSTMDSVQALLSINPTGIEDLFPRRSHAINAASEMLRSNPTTRADVFAECVQSADSQLYQSKLDETVKSLIPDTTLQH
ncbi:hypothetical protein B0H10DRAFT_1964002 [Mycena sp. CBHHK59/15]|nr:hypothetical protein B0H10DRAFT_1964002 [Mycena sp. CBHHK59/15]